MYFMIFSLHLLPWCNFLCTNDSLKANTVAISEFEQKCHACRRQRLTTSRNASLLGLNWLLETSYDWFVWVTFLRFIPGWDPLGSYSSCNMGWCCETIYERSCHKCETFYYFYHSLTTTQSFLSTLVFLNWLLLTMPWNKYMCLYLSILKL